MALQKNRQEHRVYLAEGDKLVREWLQNDAPVQHIVCLAEWIEANKALISRHPEAELTVVEAYELEAISTLKTPNQALVVAPFPTPSPLPANEWCLALETVQDPGNLGTIIRIADWFGIKHVVCSEDCADAFSPKVVQSGMGGHLRVQLHKTDLRQFIASATIPVIAATLNGTDAYDAQRQDAAILMIGNESKGLSEGLISLATERITIPRRGGAESLNAAVSAGILCALLVGR